VNCSANLIRAHLGEVADFPVEGLVVRPETELFSTVCSLSCGVLHNSLVGGDDRDFLDQLAMALSRCLPAQTIDRRDSLAARIVQAGKVREMLTEENDMTLGDICREIGYSSRAVRRTFLEVYGVSPSQYRLAVRLSRVREELKQNPEATGAISFSASRQGFSHMGRFSGQYRRQFGETPSETLRRYRSRSVCF
jgi:AraC-like DNA-binding protein